MNKRLLKRHQRQVSRAKERAGLSEPDLRTPQQRNAARELSRRVAGPHDVPRALYSTPSIQDRGGHAAGSAVKVDAGS